MINGVLWSLFGISVMIVIVLLVTRLKGKPVKRSIIQKDMLHILMIWSVVMVVFYSLK